MAGVEVIDQISIKNNPDQGVVVQNRVIGGTGLIVVDNTALLAIPAASRETGMEVKQLSPEKYFKLEADLTTWIERVQTGYVLTSEKGAANGVAPLDANGFIPSIHIKNLFLNDSFVVTDEAAMLALTSLTGNFAIREDTGDVYVKLNSNGPPSVIGDWAILTSPGVATVNGQTGGVSIDFTALLAWGSSESQFQEKVTSSDYATTTNSAISALQGRATALETDQHTHSNKAILDNIINSGDGTSFLANDGNYIAVHTHSNLTALDKIDDTGAGDVFLAKDGVYRATPGGLGDAPVDGTQYARKDAGWVTISSVGQTPWTSKIDAATNYLYNISTIRDVNEKEVIGISSVASAVNYIDFKNSAPGTNILVSSLGSDTNIGITINTKGSSGVTFRNTSQGSIDLIKIDSGNIYFRNMGGGLAQETNYVTLINDNNSLKLRGQTGSDYLHLGANFIDGSASGLLIGKISSSKLAFYGKTPIILQTTTSQMAATFVANSSGIADDTGTWNGYTVGDLVAILQAYGLLT